MIAAALWYLATVLVGIAALPLVTLLFDRLPSRGVLLARPIGLLLVTWLAWTAARTGLVPWGAGLAWGAVVAVAGASAAACRWRHGLLDALAERWRILAGGEIAFALLFALLLAARTLAPAAIGTEKPMDLMIITAVHRADTMPPPDPWLAGYSLSYYHLGHAGADVLAQLADETPARAFNLVTASTAATAVVGVGAIALDILGGQVRRRRAALLGGIAAGMGFLLIAPFAALTSIVSANGIARGAASALGIEGIPPVGGTRTLIPTLGWWWWPSTRVLPETISEYPAFTVLLGDPHAHLLALPLGASATALAVQVLSGATPLTWRSWFVRPERLALTALLFAGIAMTNAWDVAGYGALWGAAAILAYARAGWRLVPAVLGAARWAAVPAVLALALAWPMLGDFDPPPTGIALVGATASDPVRFLAFWLAPALPALGAWLVLRPRIERRATSDAAVALGVAVVAWAIAHLASGSSAPLERGSSWVTLLLLVAVGAICAGGFAAADRDEPGAPRDPAVSAACFLLGMAACFVLVTELLRVADAFPYRLNTVFKVWLQAWLLVAAGGGVAVGLAVERLDAAPPRRRFAAAACGVGVLASALAVPAIAVSRAREGQPRGIDAVAGIGAYDPGLVAVADWARANLDPARDVIAQAVGESYRGGNMLSVLSAVPAPLAWPNHERQWRGAPPEAERRALVDAIYVGLDPLAAARAGGVTYVYVGMDERVVYGPEIAVRFADWPIAAEGPRAVLFRVPAGGAQQ